MSPLFTGICLSNRWPLVWCCTVQRGMTAFVECHTAVFSILYNYYRVWFLNYSVVFSLLRRDTEIRLGYVYSVPVSTDLITISNYAAGSSDVF